MKDLTGLKFGRWTVLQLCGSRPGGHLFWKCRCECGTIAVVGGSPLSLGRSRSCGCFKLHGHAGRTTSRTYISWVLMRRRCRNRNREFAHRYVKRGITVCDRWKSFVAFLEDMGERPPGKTLERKNNNLGYSPDNCKWSTRSEQVRNRCTSKLTFSAATEIAERRLRGEKLRSIAADFAVSEATVGDIAAGRTWRDALEQAEVQRVP